MNQQGNKNPSSAPVWPHRRKTVITTNNTHTHTHTRTTNRISLAFLLLFYFFVHFISVSSIKIFFVFFKFVQQQTDFVQKQIDFHVVKWENVQAGLLYLNNKVNTDRLAL